MPEQENLIFSDRMRLEQLTRLFRTLGDDSRIKILYLLSRKELSVSAIAERLSMTESAVSHHLRILRMNNLVKGRRDGKTILYQLIDHHVRSILMQECDSIGEQADHRSCV